MKVINMPRHAFPPIDAPHTYLNKPFIVCWAQTENVHFNFRTIIKSKDILREIQDSLGIESATDKANFQLVARLSSFGNILIATGCMFIRHVIWQGTQRTEIGYSCHGFVHKGNRFRHVSFEDWRERVAQHHMGVHRSCPVPGKVFQITLTESLHLVFGYVLQPFHVSFKASPIETPIHDHHSTVNRIATGGSECELRSQTAQFENIGTMLVVATAKQGRPVLIQIFRRFSLERGVRFGGSKAGLEFVFPLPIHRIRILTMIQASFLGRFPL
mmetsp:Transcript_39446/g.111853  ORF Transcript_39446/g.111853 Transcript_39446/m.111853 type:complete len:272 (-) Transcript_39446:54-869(-)